MIDTMKIFYNFSDLDSYNECYKIIDGFAKRISKNKNCLHKIEKGKYYMTTAFKYMGFLEIAFCKRKKYKECTIQMIIKPAQIIHNNYHITLAKFKDYEEVGATFNILISSVNCEANKHILPSFPEWKVSRVDYAFDLQTPYVNEYIRLLKQGYIPKHFHISEEYDTSVYLISKKCRINFYDKLTQGKDELGITDKDI